MSSDGEVRHIVGCNYSADKKPGSSGSTVNDSEDPSYVDAFLTPHAAQVFIYICPDPTQSAELSYTKVQDVVISTSAVYEIGH